MFNVIEDGTGDGFRARVCKTNRLFTTSETSTVSLVCTVLGNTFSFASGSITLTTASASALLYVKNNEDLDLIVESMRFQAFDSTGGAGGIPIWTVLKNPTAGTIVSAGTVATPSNANFGSTNTVNVDMRRGGEGFTFTDGTTHANLFGDKIPHNFRLETAEFVIPRGSAIGIRVTPPAGNTNWSISAGFRGFFSETLGDL